MSGMLFRINNVALDISNFAYDMMMVSETYSLTYILRKRKTIISLNFSKLLFDF